MATAWQTMEEAALTLGVSSRTLHRRITKGEYETRLNNGRREVLVDVGDAPDPAGAASEAASPVHGTPDEAMEEHQDRPGEQALLALHEDRLRRTDLAIAAYQQSVTVAAMEARRWRIGARIAWSCAGACVIALFLTALWATHRLTAASAEVTTLTGQVRQLSDRTDAQGRMVEQFRRQAESARVDAARAQGALSVQQQLADQAARQLSDAMRSSAATTQPSLLTQVIIPPAVALPQASAVRDPSSGVSDR